jgi:CRISPR/Cas system-associated endoribonuclease Cas2
MSGDKEEILTQKWWEKVRFSHFGGELAAILNKNKKLKDELRKLFKDQNDKLSYYDLFQFIENKLKIQLEDWEEDALEGRLDRLGFAFIEWNEFNEFSMEYDLDWNEPLLENDLEDQLDAKINLSYKDYQLTSADYFQGCETMLRSEKAALAKVRSIWKTLKANHDRDFLDKDFGPKNAKDD